MSGFIGSGVGMFFFGLAAAPVAVGALMLAAEGFRRLARLAKRK